MPPSQQAAAASRRPQTLLIILVNLCSVACLIWVLHGANLGELRREVAHLDWRWVTVSAVSGVLVYVLQAFRWNLVLAPVQPVPIGHTMRAIYVGLFANEVLPLRAGEVIRCFLQARWTRLPLSVTLASALIERIFDGVWLIACLIAGSRLAPRLPRFIVDGGYALAFVLLVCAAFLAVAMYWKEQTLDALLKARWLGWVHILIKDLHLIGHSRYLYFAFFATFPFLIAQVIPIYALFRAYGPLAEMDLASAFVMMVILRLGAVVPQAPGSLGAFNALTVVTLLLYHVPRALAKRFSILLWCDITLPLLAAGFIALAITGLKINELKRQAENTMNQSSENLPAARRG